MVMDGHFGPSLPRNLGVNNPNLLYRWKAEMLTRGGPAVQAMDSQLAELRDELVRTRRERDLLKKALAIFSRQE